MIEGTLDAVMGGKVLGWAWDDTRPDDPVVVELYDHDTGVFLQKVTAGLYRSDLRQAGKGNGRHGFSVSLSSVSGKRELAVAARVARTVYVLRGSPLHIEIEENQQTYCADRTSNLRDRFCPMPFTKLVLQPDGARLCCPSYLPIVVGNVFSQTLDEMWNSETAIEVRRSIVDGDFQHCLDLCPAIGQGALPSISEVPPDLYEAAVKTRDGPFSRAPEELALLYDRSCNLACPSCRSSVIAATPQERAEFASILDRVIRPALKSLKVLEFGGGEVFASRHLRAVLGCVDRRENPDLRVAIMTNATLFNRETWHAFPNIHGIVRLVYASLDAATKDTFEELRHGGKWEKTMENVEFISSLRREKAIDEFGILFVVQARNFREMKAFVRLGKRLGCDRIQFHELVDFGSYQEGEFDKRSVASPQHRLHQELLAELRDPVFDDPCVNLANLRSIRLSALRA